ncbi:MAG: dihydroorotase [Bacteroidales bacterium]|nr:dihydroorotase [Bacteroidales bacterium]
MNRTLITQANIINEGETFTGHLLIENDRIAQISRQPAPPSVPDDTRIIHAAGKWLLPGVIDDQVHFRDPGLTYKADIYTESKAAVAGGVTSFMDMPNTIPQTTTRQYLDDKFTRAAEISLANFSFYLGATNDNLSELQAVNPKTTCGIKVFMGGSTGNMLVNDPVALDHIFRIRKVPIAVHCEDEDTIRQNLQTYRREFGDDIPIENHPLIRSEAACYRSSSFAVELARRYQTRLHLIHISTAKELELLDPPGPVKQKKITTEVCIHHLWFQQEDYADKGNLIKWNPAVKTGADREALIEALLSDRIDVVATDHAPHTLEEKDQVYTLAPSGAPMVQHSLTAMLEFAHQGRIPVEKVIEKMCHAPADLFQIHHRGYLREGYFADLVLVDPHETWTVNSYNILYKCGWSPLEGTTFRSKVTHTFVNGNLVYDNGIFDESVKGTALQFDR